MSDQLTHEKSPETKNANALRDTLAQRIHQQINDVTASAPQKITLDEVCSLVQISRATIYRRIKSGTFPAPVKVPSNAARGPKTVSRWGLSEVESWMRENLHEINTFPTLRPSPDLPSHIEVTGPPQMKMIFRDVARANVLIILGVVAAVAAVAAILAKSS